MHRFVGFLIGDMSAVSCLNDSWRLLFPVLNRTGSFSFSFSFIGVALVLSVMSIFGVSGNTRSAGGGAGYDVIELRYRIDEELPASSVVGDVVADANLTSLYGQDHSIVERLRFRFMKQHSSANFVIDFRSGVIRTASRIDRETTCPATDHGDPGTETVCTVRLDVGVQPVEFFRIIRVVVEINDVNDNAPEFPVYADSASASRRRQLVLDILESAPIGSSLALPAAVDRDGSLFSELTYQLTFTSANAPESLARPSSPDDFMSLKASDNVFPFRLMYQRRGDGTQLRQPSSDSIRLQLSAPLDRETVAEYHLTVVATDAGVPSPLTGSIDVVVRVGDTNDNWPEFERPVYDVTVAEDVRPNTPVVRVAALDHDAAGPNAAVTYSFDQTTTSAHGHLFAIDALSGLVSVVGEMDRDRGPSSYRLTVVARDQGADPLSTTAIVRVNITDVNDMSPEIVVDGLVTAPVSVSKSHLHAETVRVVENSRSGTPVAHVTVIDGDEGDSGRFNCTLVHDDDTEDEVDDFRLRRFYESEFQLVVAADVGERTIDRERRDEYRLTIICTDFGHPVAMTSRQAIVVVVDDVNDNVPVFDQSLYRADLIENNYVGATVLQVTATDVDSGQNARIQYRLVTDDRGGSEYFRCDPVTGMISASRPIDREALLTSGAENGGSISFHVVASDGGSPPHTGSTLVSVTVQDVNDNRPTFDYDDSFGSFRFAIAENQPPGTSVGLIRASDPDAGVNGFVRYFIDNGHEMDSISSLGVASAATVRDFDEAFVIDPETGLLSTNRMLDAEDDITYRLAIVAYDHGVPPQSSTVSVTIEITDVNDNAPIFHFPSTKPNADDFTNDFAATVHVSPLCPVGHVFFRLSAVDRDRTAGVVEFHLTDDNHGPFSVDRKTGNVIITSNGAAANSSFDPRLPLSTEIDGRLFALTVAAVDAGGLATSGRLNIVVNRSATIDFRFASKTMFMSDSDPNGSHSVAANRRRSLVVGLHVTVVASVVAVSVVATIGLLIAILIVVIARRRKNRKRKFCVASKLSLSSSPNAHQYNCRAAAEEASARLRGQYGDVTSSLRCVGNHPIAAGGNLSAPLTPSSGLVTSCAWYSTPAEMRPVDEYGDYRVATVGTGRSKMKAKENVNGVGGTMNAMKWDEGSYINHVSTGNRTGSRRSPFGSPKFSAGVAPRHVINCTSSSVVVLSPPVDVRRTNGSAISISTLPTTGRAGRLPSNLLSGSGLVPPANSAAIVSFHANVATVATATGDDGSNTDSGRGPSEEDVAELPPSAMNSSAGSSFGGRHLIDSSFHYNDIDGDSDANDRTSCLRLHHLHHGGSRQSLKSNDSHNHRDSVVLRTSGPSSNKAGVTTSGFDTGKRVRFQAYADREEEPMTVSGDRNCRGGSGLGPPPGSTDNVWRRAHLMDGGFYSDDSRVNSSASDQMSKRPKLRTVSNNGSGERLNGHEDVLDDEDVDDDDGGTTTSGSYDPTELSHEIDRLFFAQNTTSI